MPLDEKQLAEALRTGKAMTRDGRTVTSLYLFKGLPVNRCCLYGVIDGEIHSWHIGGGYVNNRECPADLSPYVEPKPVIERWVNVYSDWESVAYFSKARADQLSDCDRIGLMHITYDPNKPFGQRVTVEEIALEESK